MSEVFSCRGSIDSTEHSCAEKGLTFFRLNLLRELLRSGHAGSKPPWNRRAVEFQFEAAVLPTRTLGRTAFRNLLRSKS